MKLQELVIGRIGIYVMIFMPTVISALKGKTSPAWVFTAKGNGAYLAGALRKNIPNQDSVFTLATLFCGADLSTLEAMIHDDNHART